MRAPDQAKPAGAGTCRRTRGARPGPAPASPGSPRRARRPRDDTRYSGAPAPDGPARNPRPNGQAIKQTGYVQFKLYIVRTGSPWGVVGRSATPYPVLFRSNDDAHIGVRIRSGSHRVEKPYLASSAVPKMNQRTFRTPPSRERCVFSRRTALPLPARSSLLAHVQLFELPRACVERRVDDASHGEDAPDNGCAAR